MLNITKQKCKAKPLRRYHLTFVRMTIIKKTTDNKCWQGCGEKRILYTVAGNVNDVATVENSLEVPQKTKNRTAYNPQL